jgi:hypothetical protein
MHATRHFNKIPDPYKFTDVHPTYAHNPLPSIHVYRVVSNGRDNTQLVRRRICIIDHTNLITLSKIPVRGLGTFGCGQFRMTTFMEKPKRFEGDGGNWRRN